MSRMDPHISNSVRVAIDEAFRQAGIVIAFPQSDVHIDMQSPIEVRLSETNRTDATIARPQLRRRAA